MKKYTRVIRKIILGSVPFLTILIAWYVYYYFKQDMRWLIPSPLETSSTFWKLAVDGSLFELISISILNLVPAFVCAIFCAVSLGSLMGINRTAHKIFYPFLSAIYPIPSLAWLPFIILFLGFTREAIWFVIFISSFMKIIYNVIGGVRNVDVEYVLAAKNLGFTKLKIIFNVILPCAFPQIITGLRVGFGSAWRSLIGAEMLVVTLGGLGKFIWMSQWFFNFDNVIIGIVVISIIGLIIEQLIFKKLEKQTLEKWGFIGNEYV